MNTNQIKDLLEKYYEGETTLEEEHLLKLYLRDNEIRNDMLPTKFFLDYTSKEASNERLKQEILEKSASKLQVEKKVIYRMNRAGGWKIIAAAAGIIFIMLTAYYLYENTYNMPKSIVITNENINQNENKEIAYQKTKKALTLISKNMDVATKNMEKLSYINKGYSGLSKFELINSGKQ